MDDFAGLLVTALPFIALIVVAFFVLRRGNMAGRTMKCTRCEGTGQVNERWPDPNAPGGWHVLEGTCPKCKGKGKV